MHPHWTDLVFRRASRPQLSHRCLSAGVPRSERVDLTRERPKVPLVDRSGGVVVSHELCRDDTTATASFAATAVGIGPRHRHRPAVAAAAITSVRGTRPCHQASPQSVAASSPAQLFERSCKPPDETSNKRQRQGSLVTSRNCNSSKRAYYQLRDKSVCCCSYMANRRVCRVAGLLLIESIERDAGMGGVDQSIDQPTNRPTEQPTKRTTEQPTN